MVALAGLEPESSGSKSPVLFIIPHCRPLTILNVNSLITHNDFMYPIYGTCSTILSWSLATAKQEMPPNVLKPLKYIYIYSMVADHPNSTFFPCLSFFSFAHDTPPIGCFLVGKGTGVRPFRPNLSKHLLLLSPIPAISSANLPSSLKSQRRNSLSVQKNLF